MARKSAARMKVVKDDRKLQPIEEVFEDAKKMFAMTVDTQVKLAGRVDNLMNIRDFARKFWGSKYDDMFMDGEEEWEYLQHLQNISIETYKDVRKRVDQFELVDFRAVEVKDYFADIIPDVKDIAGMGSLCVAALKFMSVQPYGSKLMQLHQMMQEEFAKRDIFDDTEIKDEEENDGQEG